MLHIYFNALQAAFTSLDVWDSLERALRALSRFLSKSLLRNQFVRVLGILGEGAEVFESFSGGCFNWRWEKLEGLVKQLRMVLPEMLKRMRADNFVSTLDTRDDHGDEEHSTKNIVAGVMSALKTPNLLWWIELIHVICCVVGREARWQEGCRCHGDAVRGTGKPYPKRRRLMAGKCHEDDCTFKGRRTVENVMGHILVTIENIRAAASGTLTQLTARIDIASRTRLRGIPSLLKERIIEELSFKLKFYMEYPWLILEILAPLFGGTLAQSKARAVHVLEWYDKTVADYNRTPRGFDELLGGKHTQHTRFRRQLERYSTTDVPLESCSYVVRELLAYALAASQ